MKPNALTVDSSLKVRIHLGDGRGTSAVAQLDRIGAQQLANALLEYSGARSKSVGRGSRVASVPADCSLQTLLDRYKALVRSGGK